MAAKGEEDAIWSLLLDHIGDVLRGDREVVDLVGENMVRLDGGNVGIDQYGGNPSLLKGLEGLRA